MTKKIDSVVFILWPHPPEVVVILRATLGEECSDDLAGIGSSVGVREWNQPRQEGHY